MQLTEFSFGEFSFLDFSSFFRMKRKGGMMMLTVEEKAFLDHYKKSPYHRFYEIERFVSLSEKLRKRSPQADKN